MNAKLVYVPLVSAAALILLSACNTIEGAGQDLKNTGAWIEKKANANK